MPTAERVIKHLRATHVLNASRSMSLGRPQTADKRLSTDLDQLREYAVLVGTPEAEQIVNSLQEEIHHMAAAPSAAKASVAAAYRTSRSSKNFDKK